MKKYLFVLTAVFAIFYNQVQAQANSDRIIGILSVYCSEQDSIRSSIFLVDHIKDTLYQQIKISDLNSDFNKKFNTFGIYKKGKKIAHYKISNYQTTKDPGGYIDQIHGVGKLNIFEKCWFEIPDEDSDLEFVAISPPIESQDPAEREYLIDFDRIEEWEYHPDLMSHMVNIEFNKRFDELYSNNPDYLIESISKLNVVQSYYDLDNDGILELFYKCEKKVELDYRPGMFDENYWHYRASDEHTITVWIDSVESWLSSYIYKEPRLIFYEYRYTPSVGESLGGHTLIDILDIDKDGNSEVICYNQGYESGAYEIFKKIKTTDSAYSSHELLQGYFKKLVVVGGKEVYGL